MTVPIINAYVSYKGEIVAIVADGYYVLTQEVPLDKRKALVDKINARRTIDTNKWGELKR